MSEKNFSGVFFHDSGFDYRRLAEETWEKIENEKLVCFASVNSKFPFFNFPSAMPDQAFDPEYDRKLVGEKIGLDFLHDEITENSSPFFLGYVASRCSAFLVQWKMEPCEWLFEGEQAFPRRKDEETKTPLREYLDRFADHLARKSCDDAGITSFNGLEDLLPSIKPDAEAKEAMDRLREEAPEFWKLASRDAGDGRTMGDLILWALGRLGVTRAELEKRREAEKTSDNPDTVNHSESGYLQELRMNVRSAWSSLKNAMEVDPAFAWSVHCNVAVASLDEGADHKTANAVAARVMRGIFEIDIQQTAQWKSLEDEWKKQGWQASEAPQAVVIPDPVPEPRPENRLFWRDKNGGCHGKPGIYRTNAGEFSVNYNVGTGVPQSSYPWIMLPESTPFRTQHFLNDYGEAFGRSFNVLKGGQEQFLRAPCCDPLEFVRPLEPMKILSELELKKSAGDIMRSCSDALTDEVIRLRAEAEVKDKGIWNLNQSLIAARADLKAHEETADALRKLIATLKEKQSGQERTFAIGDKVATPSGPGTIYLVEFVRNKPCARVALESGATAQYGFDCLLHASGLQSAQPSETADTSGPDEFQYNWDTAPEWAMYAVTDENGDMHWNGGIPRLSNVGNFWVSRGPARRFFMGSTTVANWKNSLRKRPSAEKEKENA